MKIKLTYDGNDALLLSPKIPPSKDIKSPSPLSLKENCIKHLTVELENIRPEGGGGVAYLDFELLNQEEKNWLNENCILTEGEKKYLKMDCKIYDFTRLHNAKFISSSVRHSGGINEIDLKEMFIKIEYDPEKAKEKEYYEVNITERVKYLDEKLEALLSKPKPTL